MPSVHDGSLNRLTCALREVGNLTQTWHLQRQHLERVEQPETSTTPPHPPHGLLVTPLFHRSWILKIFEENETFRQSTAIERNYFYQKMDRSIYKRRPRAVISKSAWSQNKRRKKKGKKTGDNKNGATMERRDPRILPSPPCGNSSFQNQGEYAAVESARWQRIKRLLDIRTGSPVRCRNSCINLRARGYTAAAMDAECVKACVITRYLCVQIPLSRLRGGEDGSPFYYGLTVATSWGRGFEYGTGQTYGKSKRVHTEG